MNTRVLSLFAVGVAITVGLWLVTNREEPGPRGEPIVTTSDATAPVADSPRIPSAAGAQKPSATLTPARPVPDPTTVNGAPVPAATTTPPTFPPPPAPGTNPTAVLQPPPSAAPMLSQPSAPASNPPAASSEETVIDLGKVTSSLRDYRTIMKENPVGTNAEITQALNGGNRKQARLLQQDLVTNGNGELVDRWGTPFFFHQLSKDDMEIHSAGPDKTMGTSDDIVSH